MGYENLSIEQKNSIFNQCSTSIPPGFICRYCASMSIYRAPFPGYAIILTGPIGLVKNGRAKLEYASNQETAENIAFFVLIT